MDEAIRITGLSKNYNGFRALDGLDLVVQSGHVVGFLGPNGAGKTTAIKILTRLIRPTAGRAYLWDVDVTEDPEAAMERVGALVETPELYPELTPREFLAYVGRLRGMLPVEVRRRSREVLEEVKMADWIDKRAGKFSKGMKQRVSIAQALLHDPELLILDEPTSGLDPRGMAEVRGLIKNLGKRGVTVFMSSHLLFEIQETCDRVALINKGKLLMYNDLDRLNLLRKGGRVAVETLSPISADIVRKTRELPGVKGLTGPEGTTMVVEMEDGGEDRATLLDHLVRWGLRIRSFKDLEMPLESLYLDLIEDSG